MFYPVDSDQWAVMVGERDHITLIDLVQGNTVVIVVDSADDVDHEALVEAAQPIIGSLELPPC